MSLVLVGGGALIWSNRQPAERPNAAEIQPGGDPAPVLRARSLPPIPIGDEVGNPAKLHGITYAIENGTAIVKIKVIADGDELIVDASTGRLIESRPSRPSAPPAMGKFAAPFVPMM